jgi:peptidoglycan/LPS O-acetylase OafA/YrhL
VTAAATGWRPTYLPQLDGLRAGAVLLVVAYHASATGHEPRLRGAFIGVDVFFVLSGFLITSLLLQEQRNRGRIALGAFYRRRFWRLYPALVLVCLVSVAWYELAPDSWHSNPPQGHRTKEGALYALTYVASEAVAASQQMGYLGHTWSLSVEEHFYVVWPLLFLFLLRRGGRSLVRNTAVLTGFAITWPFVMAALGGGANRLYSAPDTRAGQLLIGCLLGTLLATGTGAAWVDRIAGRGAAIAALLLLGVCVLTLQRQDTIYLTLGQAVIGLASAVLIAHLVLRRSPITRLLSWRPAVTVGTWSYGIYLWHVPALYVPYPLVGRGLVSHALGAVLAIGLAALSFRYFERPLLQRFGRKPTPAVEQDGTGVSTHPALS